MIVVYLFRNIGTRPVGYRCCAGCNRNGEASQNAQPSTVSHQHNKSLPEHQSVALGVKRSTSFHTAVSSVEVMFTPQSSEEFCSPLDQSSEYYTIDTLSVVTPLEETPRGSPVETPRYMSVYSWVKGVSGPSRLPWWWVYIAWILLMGMAVVCSYIVMLYGLRYGYAKSVSWLVSLLTCFFSGTGVMKPLKVVLITAILSLIFATPACPRADYSNYAPGNDLDVDQVTGKPRIYRRQSGHLYQPPKITKIDKVKRKMMREKELWSTLFDVGLYLSYALAIGWVIAGHIHPLSYWTTANTRNMLLHGHYDTMSIHKVESYKDLYDFINETFIPVMSTSDWPVTLDGVSITLGQIRVRQHRIKPHLNPGWCPLPEALVKSPMICKRVSLSDDTWDKAEYDIGWQPLSNSTEDVTNSPWKYQHDSTILQASTLVGYGGYRHGYMAQLPNQLEWGQLMLGSLKEQVWLDNLTRYVVLEASTYYPALNILNFMVIQLEFNDLGLVSTSTFIHPTPYKSLSGPASLTAVVAEILFLVFTVFYTFWEGYKLYRTRNYGKFFHNGWVLVDCLMLALAYCCIPVYLLRLLAEREAMVQYSDTQKNGFVNLHTLVFWDLLLSYMLGFILLLVIINFLKVLRFNKHMVVLFSTLESMRPALSGYLFLLTISITLFVAILYPILGTSCYDYRSISTSVMSIFSLTLMEMQFHPEQCHQTMGSEWLTFYLVLGGVFVGVFYPLVQATLNYFARKMRHSLSKLDNEFELIDFAWGKVMVTFGIWKIEKYHTYVDAMLARDLAAAREAEINSIYCSISNQSHPPITKAHK